MNDKSKTAGSVILGAFEENRDRIAIMESKDYPQITYGELLDRACRVAAFLEDKGIEPGKGKRIAISMNRNPRYVVAFMGCLIFGYAAVLLDPEYPESRRLKILLLSSYWMKRTTLWRWNAKRLIRMMLLKRRRKLSSYIHPARREIPKA